MSHTQDDAPSDLLLTSQAARLLGVSGQTIRAWDRRNRLKPALRSATGLRLYARADIEALRHSLEEQRGATAQPSPQEAA